MRLRHKPCQALCALISEDALPALMEAESAARRQTLRVMTGEELMRGPQCGAAQGWVERAIERRRANSVITRGASPMGPSRRVERAEMELRRN